MIAPESYDVLGVPFFSLAFFGELHEYIKKIIRLCTPSLATDFFMKCNGRIEGWHLFRWKTEGCIGGNTSTEDLSVFISFTYTIQKRLLSRLGRQTEKQF